MTLNHPIALNDNNLHGCYITCVIHLQVPCEDRLNHPNPGFATVHRAMSCPEVRAQTRNNRRKRPTVKRTTKLSPNKKASHENRNVATVKPFTDMQPSTGYDVTPNTKKKSAKSLTLTSNNYAKTHSDKENSAPTCTRPTATSKSRTKSVGRNTSEIVRKIKDDNSRNRGKPAKKRAQSTSHPENVLTSTPKQTPASVGQSKVDTSRTDEFIHPEPTFDEIDDLSVVLLTPAAEQNHEPSPCDVIETSADFYQLTWNILNEAADDYEHFLDKNDSVVTTLSL